MGVKVKEGGETETAQENPAISADLDELVTDALSVPQPETEGSEGNDDQPEAAPAGDEPATTDEPAGEKPSAAAPTAKPDGKPEAKPAPKSIKFEDKEYTAEQLLADPDMLAKLATRAEQTRYYQTQLEAARRTPPPEQPAQPAANVPDPAATMANLHAKYDAKVKQLVKDGFFTEDEAELVPNLALHGAVIADELSLHRAALEKIAEMINGSAQQTVASQARAELEALYDGVAAKDEAFSWLKDPEGRKGFHEFIVQLNPMSDQVNPEFMERMALAYKHNDMLALARGIRTRDEESRKRKARLAVGESGSPRAGAKPRTERPSDLDELVDERLGA